MNNEDKSGGPMYPSVEIDANGQSREWPGETRRQALARCAMQGILANSTCNGKKSAIVSSAWEYADAMIAFEASERAEKDGAK